MTSRNITGRKERFNEWYESVVHNLEMQYINCDLDISTRSLQREHWGQLWRIFENYVEYPHKGSKEQMESLEIADNAAREVILSAHGESSYNLDWKVQMDHYMNSSQCD